MKIIDKLIDGEGGYSLEFFPPKTDKGVENLKKKVNNFYQKELPPLFIDITWGAGGSTSELTLDLAEYFTKQKIDVNMHLTCTNMSVDKINQTLNKARDFGIQNLVTLRGDPPTSSSDWKGNIDGFNSAINLVEHVNNNHSKYFCQAVAGYPEGHTDQIKEVVTGELCNLSESEKLRLSQDMETGKYYVCRDLDYWNDLKYLKKKVEMGGDLIITQLFFDPQIFIQFVKDCRSIDITCPILPGIMLVQSIPGFKRMVSLCRVKVPEIISKRITEIEQDIDNSSSLIMQYGEELGCSMCQELFDADVRFFHLYTLNREKVTGTVIQYISKLLTEN